MNAKTLFFFCMKNTIWSFSLETLGCTHKNIFSLFQIFFVFWKFLWKPGILIPNLYFYGIKIQTNMKQNLVEKTRENKFTIFEKEIFFFQLSWTRPNHFGLGRHCRPIKQWASPLFTFNINSGEADAEEEEEEREREEGWPAVPYSAAGSSGGGRTRLLAVAGAR